MLGIDPEKISYLKSGKRKPGKKTIAKFTAFFEKNEGEKDQMERSYKKEII